MVELLVTNECCVNTKQEQELRRAAEQGTAVSQETALAILRADPDELPEIMAYANSVRIKYLGDEVRLCSILNAQSGACAEDCAFCAQSASHNADIEAYDLCSEQKILDAHEEASALPIDHFGVVTSGCALDDEGVARICRALRERKGPRVKWCASLGALGEEQLRALKEAGLTRFHHNVETAGSFFNKVCSTHTFEERIETVRKVKALGLEVCCGGILGLGETLEQRVELAMTLAEEEVDSIPLNFLMPIPGTPLEGRAVMKPLDMLKSIAMFRMTNPRAEIKVCAGRSHLGDLQSMIFYAGATGMMIGDLLTIAGRDVETDLKMLEDLQVGRRTET